MANTKYAPVEQLSGWLEYRLVTEKLDPPVFRCRLRFINPLNTLDGFFAEGKMRFSRILLDAIAEWDLATDGVPIPLTDENKTTHMSELVGEAVDGRGIALGMALLEDAGNRENFVKN